VVLVARVVVELDSLAQQAEAVLLIQVVVVVVVDIMEARLPIMVEAQAVLA
jgi:hypothetical protein